MNAAMWLRGILVYGILSCKSAAISHASAPSPIDGNLLPCGDAFYYPDKYTCYGGNFLCPVINGQTTSQCGPDCFLPEQYSCKDGKLTQPDSSTYPSNSTSECMVNATSFTLEDAPYINYFYSDCHSASQVVVTSPLPDSNLTLIGPRLLVAWPAGNSGIVAFFTPANGINGTLNIRLVNYTTDQPLKPVYEQNNGDGRRYGIKGLIQLNSTALLKTAILGSIRTIRDFTEGPSILVPLIQDAIKYESDSTSVALVRQWLDNVTTTELTFASYNSTSQAPELANKTITLEAGTYEFSASFNYPQLSQLSAADVLNPSSQDLIQQQPLQANSLAFLSYSEKLLAGAWRFLTYFGRDSMISLLLLRPVLSEGQGGAVEAIISAVLERVNSTDGSVCHEETVGDYAQYQHLTQENRSSTAPICTYVMIDTDYYLPIVLAEYLLDSPAGKQRSMEFPSTTAKLDFGNKGKSYASLASLTFERILGIAAPFAASGNQTMQNLAHLKADQIVGEWRDSTYGIGGGRVPFDVNTALVPAALRAIARLSEAGIGGTNGAWADLATAYAEVWESQTLSFFQVSLSSSEARTRLSDYILTANVSVPANTDLITTDDPVQFYALALNGTSGQDVVRVMHTDVAFRLFLLNVTSGNSDREILSRTATQILQPFPVGLSSSLGLFVANPAYGGDPVYAANFSRAEYHGTVVWGWPMAMMAKGLERQLDRCSDASTDRPSWCGETATDGVYSLLVRAYNHLWDLIEANEQYLSGEVWSWNYADGAYQYAPLGSFSSTESNIRQLWSLTFLAIKRNEAFR